MPVNFWRLWIIALVALAVISAALHFRYAGQKSNIPVSNGDLKPAPSQTLARDSSFYDQSLKTINDAIESATKLIGRSSGTDIAPELVLPEVSASSFLIGNVETGQVYVKKNAERPMPVASMSKLITAIAAADFLPATTSVTITEEMLVATSTDTSKLSAGETFQISELMYPMLLNSSNIAAEAIASATDRHGFIRIMSGYAKEIGMPRTSFADPSGLNPLNMSSASDFFALARYLYKTHPEILALTQTETKEVASTTDHLAHNFFSIHPFVRAEGFLGGKTGHTNAAKDTMLTIMRIKNQPIAFVVLASDDRRQDTKILIDYVSELVK
jgi:D-alanyl-D-alanine carboxypeptidase